MKIRNGFVSNSSTSSFVVVGFKISPEEYRKKINGAGATYEDAVYLDSSGYLVGEVISNGEELDDSEISILDLYDIVDNVSRKYGVNESQIKLYTGTRES